jgi:general secretion pathway protein E
VAAETGQRLDSVMSQLGLVTERGLAEAYAALLGIPIATAERYPDEPLFTGRLTARFLRMARAVPVAQDDGCLIVAAADPLDPFVPAAIGAATSQHVSLEVAVPIELEAAFDRLYRDEAVAEEAVDEDGGEPLEEDAERLKDLASEGPVIRLVNQLISRAVETHASDIHIEPFDGVLSTVLETPISAVNAMIARVKILANLNIAERRAPQDGRFNIFSAGHTIDIRVSIVPTAFGEKVVMRLLDRSTFLVPKERLGLTEENLLKFNKMLMAPNGIILITGPTGSGKSTTLYTMLEEMNSIKDNITTIEDPVEYMMEGLNQIQVNPRAGIDFASGLRSILRQDPDVIMVGEIRDPETVEIAIRAAITGHLVLSTIHTNDTVSTIYRLMDMGIPSYMVAASLSGLVAQRLVRVICLKCKQTHRPSAAELKLAGIDPELGDVGEFFIGAGCESCNGTGYKGRIAVYEILSIDQSFRDMIHSEAPLGELRNHAMANGMISLRNSALELLSKGTTTLEEVISITHSL